VLGAIFDFTGSFITPLSYIQYFYFEVILALLTYYLAIAGYLRSQTIEIAFTETESEKIEEETEDKKTLLPANDLENLKARLLDLMEHEKPFLDSQLTLAALSKMLGVNTTVLSRVINTGFDKNFNDFVNEFRIDEVKNKLASGAAENTNLLGIALDSGFNSKATFNRAFKKFTGVAPKEFQGK
jgi:AraC-like DNA-binding protein